MSLGESVHAILTTTNTTWKQKWANCDVCWTFTKLHLNPAVLSERSFCFINRHPFPISANHQSFTKKIIIPAVPSVDSPPPTRTSARQKAVVAEKRWKLKHVLIHWLPPNVFSMRMTLMMIMLSLTQIVSDWIPTHCHFSIVSWLSAPAPTCRMILAVVQIILPPPNPQLTPATPLTYTRYTQDIPTSLSTVTAFQHRTHSWKFNGWNVTSKCSSNLRNQNPFNNYQYFWSTCILKMGADRWKRTLCFHHLIYLLLQVFVSSSPPKLWATNTWSRPHWHASPPWQHILKCAGGWWVVTPGGDGDTRWGWWHITHYLLDLYG